MNNEPFYISNRMTITLEGMISHVDSLEEFEKRFLDEFLANDDHVGNYLSDLLRKYDKKASVISQEAMLTHSYVGNIANGTSVEEVQYLLKYAGQAPLYVRRKRDVIIWFGFMKHMSLDEVDEKLRERNLKPLVREQ